MFNVLMVDDDPTRPDSLRVALEKRQANKDFHLTAARSVDEGLAELDRRHFDLVIIDCILDMGEGKSHDNAALIVKDKCESLHYRPDLIFLSAEPEKFAADLIPYRVIAADADWTTIITSVIEKLFRVRKRSDGFKSKALVLIAVEVEWKAAQQVWKMERWSDELFYVGNGEHRVWFCYLGRPGAVSVAVTASRLSQSLRPRVLAMCGMCGGLPEVKLNTVVIATHTTMYPRGKFYGENHDDEYLGRTAPECVHKITLGFAQHGCDVQRGGVVTVPYVLCDQATIDGFKTEDRKVKAFDMECFGVFETAQNFGSTPLWVKGVSDNGVNKDDEGDKHQERASLSAARVLCSLLKDHF